MQILYIPVFKKSGIQSALACILPVIFLFQPGISNAWQVLSCLENVSPTDAILLADHDGNIIYKKNERKKCIPASTLKLLTALTAIRKFGGAYRFKTEFYLDPCRNLKIKGYGDPLLISEVWQKIADILAEKIGNFEELLLDDTWFSQHMVIPGRNGSANPYDAPAGALCANFNTVFFDFDGKAGIITAEPQTPLIPFAKKKIRSLGLKKGRNTFIHDSKEAARYAGELLLRFLKDRGVECKGGIRFCAVEPDDKLLFTYRSDFSLEEVLQKMLKFSNNFIANQLFIALGAQAYGAPGTPDKGIRVITEFAKKDLRLGDIEIAEGSGISRKNRLSALQMLDILKQFEPYRRLLNRKKTALYKTGTLNGIRTRAGYIERDNKGPYYFVIFFEQTETDIDSLIDCITAALKK